MAEHHDAHGPMNLKKYIFIGIILTIITGIEVAIFYIPALESVLIPMLLGISVAKFAIVVMYYMHLKDDDAVLSRVFVGPLALAIFVVVALLILFKVLPSFTGADIGIG